MILKLGMQHQGFKLYKDGGRVWGVRVDVNEEFKFL